MPKPLIVSVKMETIPGGVWEMTFRNGQEAIGGQPFPSEGEAWAFGEGIKVLREFMFMSYKEQKELLRQLGIK